MTHRNSTLWLHPPKRKSFPTKETPIKDKKTSQMKSAKEQTDRLYNYYASLTQMKYANLIQTVLHRAQYTS